MWRRAEKLTPILGVLREGVCQQQSIKPGDREEALVQKK